jgi:hypothetical protein
MVARINGVRTLDNAEREPLADATLLRSEA